jgi:hypothetical protein
MMAGAALVVAASGAALGVTAVPAAARLSVSVPAIDKNEFRWLCAEADGELLDYGDSYSCYLPNGTAIECTRGGNCVIIFIHTPPGTPTPPLWERPILSAP